MPNATILVVNDNEAGRYTIRHALQNAGFTVAEAATGSECLQQLALAIPDLIILDINLPDMSGIDLCHTIKTGSRTFDIPVLLISAASAQERDRVHGLEAGADGYLMQPMDTDVLTATVNAYLRIRRIEEELRDSARRWNVTFNAINDGVALLDPTGRVTHCNNALATLLNLAREDMVGAPYHELLRLPLEKITETPFVRMVSSGRRETQTAHRGDQWFHITIDPILAAHGQLDGAVCIISDVTAEYLVEKQLEHRYEQLQTIYHLSNSLSRAHALEQIYDETFNSIATALGIRRASILLFDADKVMRFKAWRGISDAYRASTEGHTPWNADANDAQPITIDDVENDTSLGDIRDIIMNEGIRALAFIPLIARGMLLGKFMLYCDSPHKFTDEELSLARTIASHIAVAIERRRAEQERAELLALEQTARREAESARQRFEFLAEASEVLVSTLNYEESLSNAAHLAVPHIADWCSIDMMAHDGSVRQLAVAHVDPEKIRWAIELRQRYPIDLDAPNGTARVLRTGQSEFYPEITDYMLAAAAKNPEELDLLREIGFRSVMIVPIVARDRLHGAITFVSAESGKHFDSADLTLAEDLARRAAAAIDNAMLYREAQDELAERKRTETALRRSEELNRAVLDSMAAHIAVLDSTGTIIAINEAWERFSKENGKELPLRTGIGENYLETCMQASGECAEESQAVAEGLHMVLTGKLSHFSLEYPCHSPTQQRWFLLTVTPLSRESGGAVASHVDITQRKLAEEQVHELLYEVDLQRKRLNNLIASVPGVVWEAWGEPNESTQRIDFVSDYGPKMLGYSIEEWLGTPNFWLMIVHPEDKERAARESFEIFLGKRNMNQFRWVTKDGRVLWVEAHAVPIRDTNGQPIGMRGVTLDITERITMEAKLRESEERFRTMADSAPVLLWLSDDNNRGIYFNRVWLEFTGRTMEQEYGAGWIEGIHPNDRADAVEICRSAFQHGQEFRIEFRLRRYDGEYRWLLDHGVPRFTPDGTLLGYIGSCIDITDRKEIEKELEQRVHERTAELEAANKELESFSYSVSHDLRAPLRSIDGFSKALLEDYLEKIDDTGQDYLRRVRAASQRMGQLIDDMLNLSRVTRSEMLREEVDLSAMASQIVADLRNQEPDRQVDVTIAPNLVVNGDTRLLRVVLENLLGNAWKFTGQREHAEIEFGKRIDKDRAVYFVRDNGAGFDMAYADKLFTPFQRLHSIDQFQGTGVGLASVQRIIKRHGGRIWTEAKPDHGATFFFTL